MSNVITARDIFFNIHTWIDSEETIAKKQYTPLTVGEMVCGCVFSLFATLLSIGIWTAIAVWRTMKKIEWIKNNLPRSAQVADEVAQDILNTPTSLSSNPVLSQPIQKLPALPQPKTIFPPNTPSHTPIQKPNPQPKPQNPDSEQSEFLRLCEKFRTISIANFQRAQMPTINLSNFISEIIRTKNSIRLQEILNEWPSKRKGQWKWEGANAVNDVMNNAILVAIEFDNLDALKKLIKHLSSFGIIDGKTLVEGGICDYLDLSTLSEAFSNAFNSKRVDILKLLSNRDNYTQNFSFLGENCIYPLFYSDEFEELNLLHENDCLSPFIMCDGQLEKKLFDDLIPSQGGRIDQKKLRTKFLWLIERNFLPT